MHRGLLAIVTLSLMVLARPAHAVPLCEGVRTALNAAEDRFKSLRGEFDFEDDQYKSILNLGDRGECYISNDAAEAALRCSDRSLDSLESAHQEYQRAIKAIAACLGQSVFGRANPSGSLYVFKYRPTGDEIWVSYRGSTQRATSRRPAREIFSVSITVRYTDPTQ